MIKTSLFADHQLTSLDGDGCRGSSHPSITRRALLHCCLAAVALSGCAQLTGPVPAPGPAEVFVVGRGWHTDIAVPASALDGPASQLIADLQGVRFVSVGFGERQFYMNRHPSFGGMLTALLPSQSALLVTTLRAAPPAAFGAEHVVRVAVSVAARQRIVAAIWHELETTPDGMPRRLAPGPYPGSVFYASRGTYDALNTCNTWTADTLRAGGLPMPAGVLFASSVMAAARRIAAAQAAVAPDPP